MMLMPEDRIDKAAVLELFRVAAEQRAVKGISPTEHDWNLVSVAEEAGINLFHFSRDADFLNQIWVVFLTIMRDRMQAGDAALRLKYADLAAFHEVYPQFAALAEQEQRNLFESANWMAVLFTMIPAAKNKGLVLQVSVGGVGLETKFESEVGGGVRGWRWG